MAGFFLLGDGASRTLGYNRPMSYRTLSDAVGNTPLVQLARLPGATTNVMLAQARRQQPGRLGQGPAGAVDDRRGREARHDQARRHADRGDVRQHGHRARDGGGDARLPDDAGDAGEPDGRARADDARLRRRAGADAEGRRHGGGARHRRADARRRQGHDPRPVRESGQSARALSRHRSRDLARHRRPDHAFRVGDGHDRHDHGRVEVPEGKESRDPDHRRAAGGGLAIPGIRKWPPAYLPKIFDASRVDRIENVSQADAEDTARGASRARKASSAASRSGGACAVALRVSRNRSRTRRSCSSSAIAATAICPPACFPRDARRCASRPAH